MNSFGQIDFYLFYKKNFNGSSNRTTFNKVISLFFKKLIAELYNGHIVKLPYGLGSYYIEKYKPKIQMAKDGKYFVRSNKSMDFKATKELWERRPDLKAKKQRVFYENNHTDGLQVKLTRTRFKNLFIQKIYNFKPSRGFSRGLAKVIFKDPYREFIMS